MDQSGKATFCFLLFSALLCLQFACASYKIIPPSLDGQSREFLDTIRYIVTPQEERIFREIPPEDRAEFIADFWKRRDPTPETDANEFRDRYYSRLAAADKAFRAGIPGWKTDRGRIFILLGSPTDVITKSMGEHTREFEKGGRELSSDLLEEGARTERPTEIWVYNQYPDFFSGPLRLVFVDYGGTGDYRLTTDTEVKPFSMMSYLQNDPNMVKYQWIGQIESEESRAKILPFLDFGKSLGEIEKSKDDNYSVNCVIEIPFGAINYLKEARAYAYDLELGIEARYVELRGAFEEKRDMKGRLSAENLERNIREGLSLADRVTVPLEKGTNKIYFSVRDRVALKKLRKLDIVNVRE